MKNFLFSLAAFSAIAVAAQAPKAAAQKSKGQPEEIRCVNGIIFAFGRCT